MTKLLVTVWVGTVLLGAQQPPITNADLRQASATRGLDSALRAAAGEKGPVWIGYAVPKIPGEHNSCCWDQQARGCGLEGPSKRVAPTGASGPVLLEGPSHIVVLIRFQDRLQQKLRVFSPDCPLDAGGLPFFWLSDVKPSDSIALLTDWATENGRRLADAAVHAIALHSAPEAEASLQRLVQPSQPESVRKKAIFWLAHSRGRSGYETVRKVLGEDSSQSVREHAIFALTQSTEPEALRTLIQTAKEDPAPQIRSKALFWLSQKASKQVADSITEAVERDPETEVKKQAVFALSRLPKDEGIPRLIQIARTHSNPAVRKQAIFWLGQSRDSRAIAFFEQALLK